MDPLEVGEITTLEARFTDTTGALADPTAVTLTVTDPSGTETAVDPGDIDNPEVGVYTHDLTVPSAGVWTYTWTGTGAVTAGHTGYVIVGEVAPRAGPCDDWATPEQVLNCRSDLTGKVTEAQLADAICQASDLLYQLSGRRYPGICQISRSLCAPCVRCDRHTCCCRRPADSVRLPSQLPILGVVEVTVDGDTIPRAAYRVDEWRWLVRTDGDHWPHCAAFTDPDAFAITFLAGRVPPPAGTRAAAVFAGEIAAKCANLDCDIPEHVTTISREGVTFTVLDSFRMLDEERTGIYQVDAWLTAERAGQRPPPNMFDPAAPLTSWAASTDTGGAH